MFNLGFYIVCWLLFFLLCLPVIFSGLLAVALEKERVIAKKSQLGELHSRLKEFSNDKVKLKLLFDEFMGSFKTYSNNNKEYNLWLDLISNFAVNMNLMEVDEVVNFQTTLENANPESKAQIKESIGRALQKRETK